MKNVLNCGYLLEPSRAGVKGIYLGPIVPAWINQDTLNHLVEKYDIRLIRNPEEDITRMMG